MKISGRPVTANAEVSLEITPPGDCTARVDVVRLCARMRGLERNDPSTGIDADREAVSGEWLF
jgi:hypothetical protein